MTIEELEFKHFKEYLKSCIVDDKKEHTKISVQFTIEVLGDIEKYLQEEIAENEVELTEWGLGYLQSFKDTLTGVEIKIQELKQYLDEGI